MFDASFDALIPLGWGPRVQALFFEFDAPDLAPGRVTRVERDACVVGSPFGTVVARATGLPAVGDWVAISTLDGDANVHAILPRWSRLARAGADADGSQVMAANVDLVLIAAPADRLSPARVERELVIAWESGAQPLVVLTKHDIAPDGLAEQLAGRLRTVDVVATSTLTGEGIEPIAARLAPDRTGVLIGPSGSGKSSLINALLGEGRLAVGDVRAGDHRGRHTTTWRELIALPAGGVLIDTPGIRGIGLVEGGDALANTFGEIDDLAGSCRFTDCSHATEPGCALLAAVADGRVSAERLTSWRKLQRELARSDPANRRKIRDLGKQRVRGARQRRNLEGVLINGTTMTDDVLATRLATIFVFDESGRIVRNTDPDCGAGPRLYLAGCETGNIVCLRHDVGAKTARAVKAMVADEPPLRARASVPTHWDDYVELLAAEAPVEQHGHGVNYCFPPDFAYDHDVTIVSSEIPEAARVALGLADDQVVPEPLVAIGFSTVAKLWTPWCVALHDGEIASLVETVRIDPTGAEAGVNTVPKLRGRGLAAAATAGWAASPSLRGRRLFYSTDASNLSSQRVTERLGLRFVGASFSLT